MSILAKNLKIIRRELRCTQSVMSDVLKVGFRTYVRYEAGERDAPVSVLVKMAKLGNISLENLLTKEINRYDVLPARENLIETPRSVVGSVNFRAGQIVFKKPSKQELLATDEAERKLLALFRKMSPELKKVCLDSAEDSMKGGKSSRPPLRGKAASARAKGASGRSPSKSVARSRPSVKNRKKARPGRKKLDKKVYKEKIDKLKMITRSISKITVR
ncbi:MAG: hypothetical protein COV67_14050 [Nitrospinae bacterium CG11_big_fil_rev_8_21_14_0_20_56_8]|nr:MAG: hypothetical protein COV67_14050 [Nitrospinae bacterium CG11_big_fil_rev_8_21_14_0_20_56_8]